MIIAEAEGTRGPFYCSSSLFIDNTAMTEFRQKIELDLEVGSGGYLHGRILDNQAPRLAVNGWTQVIIKTYNLIAVLLALINLADLATHTGCTLHTRGKQSLGAALLSVSG